MLTGDLNVAVVEWIVQYRVSDPFLFLFKVRNVEDTFRDMNGGGDAGGGGRPNGHRSGDDWSSGSRGAGPSATSGTHQPV